MSGDADEGSVPVGRAGEMRMPTLGVGTASLDTGRADEVVHAALELGYRLVDGAVAYDNDTGVGAAIRRSGLTRRDVFVTTKLDGRPGGPIRELQACLDRLGLDHVDLALIHWPLPWRGTFVKTWCALAEAIPRGLARAVGVANFTVAHLEELRRSTGVLPAVNQIQLNPLVPRKELRSYHADHGIVTQAWNVLGGRPPALRRHPKVLEVARRRESTPAQVLVAWQHQIGACALIGSTTREQLCENRRHPVLAPQDLDSLAQLSHGDDLLLDPEVFGH